MALWGAKVISFLALGALGGGGYLVNALVSKKGESEKKIQKVENIETETSQKEIEWEYAWNYSGKEDWSCDLLIKGQQQSENYLNIGRVICDTPWAKRIKEENIGKKGLWVQGVEKSVSSLLRDTLSLEGTKFQKDISMEAGIGGLNEKYCKINKNEKNVEIACLESR